MSPEIQEWLHKSRPRINNLYLLTRPIVLRRRCRCQLKVDRNQPAFVSSEVEVEVLSRISSYPIFGACRRPYIYPPTRVRGPGSGEAH